MKVIIGLVAEKESGKTTTFNLIKSQLPSAVELMLAEHLKEACARVFNMPLICFESQVEKKKSRSPAIILTSKQTRELCDIFEMSASEADLAQHEGKVLYTTREVLQYVGTDILRAIDDDCHLKWAMRRAPESDVYVVTDIRFPNEFEFFARDSGFLSVAIDRDKVGETDASAGHASETHIPALKKKCSVRVDNNGTLNSLETQVRELVVIEALKIKNR